MTQCKAYISLKKVKWISKKEQFIAHKRELLESWSWQKMSINCFRLISFLELCYLSCAGEDNGHLIATYKQIEQYGINKRFINKAIKEAEKRGLIKVALNEQVGKWGKFTYNFRLTYLPYSIFEHYQEGDRKCFLPPTNEWKYLKENRSKPNNNHL